MVGPHTCWSLCRNPLSSSENKLAEDLPGAPNKGSNTPTLFLPVSWAQTPAEALALTSALSRGTYTDVNLQKATKLALELFIRGQAHAQVLASAARDKALDRPPRLGIPIYTMGARTWNAFTSAGNARTILKRLVLRATNTYLLWPYFSERGSTSTGSSIKLGLGGIEPTPSHGTNLRTFSKRVLENLPRLWILSGVRLKETPNINKKNYKTGPLI